jgi:3-oxoacyl-[acyl-carrier protein] reductase
MKLKGKIAFITGSGRGIGQQIALGLAQQGASIILHGRNIQNTRETQELLNDYGVETFAVGGELAILNDVDEMVKVINEKYGGIDILYNNAAISVPWKQDYWKHTETEWHHVFQINVVAMYHLCGAFIPGMIKRGYGRVINLTSGIKDQPELAPYGVSKAAVNKLTDDIAIKLVNTRVRINTLDPGWLKTDMGGPNAWYDVTAVLPGAIVPALIEDDGPNGQFFQQSNYVIQNCYIGFYIVYLDIALIHKNGSQVLYQA